SYAREDLEGVRPRLGRTKLEHRIQEFADPLVAKYRTTMEGPAPSRQMACRSVKLELIDLCEEITNVGNGGGHVIVRSWIERVIRPWCGRNETLILTYQRPPVGVVVVRGGCACEHLPAPFVHDDSEGKHGDVSQREAQQCGNVRLGSGGGGQQADLMQ